MLRYLALMRDLDLTTAGDIIGHKNEREIPLKLIIVYHKKVDG